MESPRYELSALGLVVLSSLVLIRLLLYPGRSPLDLTWLSAALGALVDFSGGIRPEWGLVLTNFFLWQRATSATSREMSFFGVGLSFRVDMLLLFVTGAVYSQVTGNDASPFLWLYFALGLLAVSIIRIHERAQGARSPGTPLPLRRLAQVLAAVVAVVGITAVLSRYYAPPGIRTAIGWFQPLWSFLGSVALVILNVLLWLLMPVLLWLEAYARSLNLRPLADVFRDIALAIPEVAEIEQSSGSAVPSWVPIALRDLGVVLVIVLALAVILLYLERARQGHGSDQPEAEGGEDPSFGRGLLERGRQRLRDLAGLVRRFGVSGELLAAISVENIYANLCRIARREGHPRRPAQPPDDYLPILEVVFRGRGEELARITAAYMRVHYGEHPVTLAELSGLRADYHEIRRAQEEAPK